MAKRLRCEQKELLPFVHEVELGQKGHSYSSKNLAKRDTHIRPRTWSKGTGLKIFYKACPFDDNFVVLRPVPQRQLCRFKACPQTTPKRQIYKKVLEKNCNMRYNIYTIY